MRKTSHADHKDTHCRMSTTRQSQCVVGDATLEICVQKNPKEGGNELCSYCKDTHPVIMYWNLERIAMHPPESMSESMSESIKEESRKNIYLNMYEDQLKRVAPGKHVCSPAGTLQGRPGWQRLGV